MPARRPPRRSPRADPRLSYGGPTAYWRSALSTWQDQAETRIAAAIDAGGRIVNDTHAPEWWTLADPEGNEVDVAPWPDRDGPADA